MTGSGSISIGPLVCSISTPRFLRATFNAGVVGNIVSRRRRAGEDDLRLQHAPVRAGELLQELLHAQRAAAPEEVVVVLPADAVAVAALPLRRKMLEIGLGAYGMLKCADGMRMPPAT